MKMMSGLLVAGLLLAASQALAAEPITGATLAEQCPAALERLEGQATAPDEAMAAAFCLAYLAGIQHMHQLATDSGFPPLFCVPEDTDISHVVRVVVSALREHPESHRLAGVVVVTEALKTAYPCKASTP